jgi:hypothetical protein
VKDTQKSKKKVKKEAEVIFYLLRDFWPPVSFMVRRIKF